MFSKKEATLLTLIVAMVIFLSSTSVYSSSFSRKKEELPPPVASIVSEEPVEREPIFNLRLIPNRDEYFYLLMPNEIRVEVEKQNKKYKIPVSLLYGLMKHEGKLDIHVRDNLNYDESGTVVLSFDVGLFQLNSKNFEEFAWKFYDGPGTFNPRNYKHNIQVGMAYYRWLYDYLDDWVLATMAYNRGPGRIKSGVLTLDNSPTLFNYTFEVVKHSL